MASLREELSNTLRTNLCADLAVTNKLEDFYRLLFPGASSALFYRTRLAYSKHCDNPPPPPSSVPPPGGQCDFCYDLTAVITVTNSLNPVFDGPKSVGVPHWGPLGGFKTYKTAVAPGGTGAGGLEFNSHGRCSFSRQPTQTVQREGLFSIDSDSVLTITTLSFVPVGGQPDTCGDAPYEPPFVPPEERSFPIDFNYTYNDGSDFNITGNVFFGFAYFDNNFYVNVPLKFVLNNNVNLTGNFNLDTGDVTLNFGDDRDVFYRPGPTGDPTTDPNDRPPPTNAPPPIDFVPPYTPNDDPDEEDPEDFPDDGPKKNPTIRRIVGVLVDTTVVGRFPTEIGQLTNPDVYAPDLGLINFAFLVNGTSFYWGEDLRVKNKRQVIFCPPGQYAVDVRGTPRSGTQWGLTPLYAQVPQPSGLPA